MGHVYRARDDGSVIMIYATGFGPTEPPQIDGHISSDTGNLILPVSATIGDAEARVLYAGSAPGLVAGVVQVNLLVPTVIPANLSSPLVLLVGGSQTQHGVTVAVR